MNNVQHILLVEDVPSDARLIEKVVKKVFPECRLLCVDSCEDYMDALHNFKPDLILSDYALPHFDGLSALKIALESAPETPFIIVTGSINEETAAECIKAGAWDYVLKEHLTRLGSAILRALEQQNIRIERRQALEALHESEERYRSIFQVASACIAVYAEGEIKLMNPAGLKLFGADCMEQLRGRPIVDLLSQDAETAVNDRLKRMCSGEQDIFPLEDVFRKLDGTPIDVELMASPLTYNNKPAVQVIITDITLRKKAEKEREKLREALDHDKSYLKSLIQNANAPIITWTPDFVITEFNHAFEELTGLKRETIIGLQVDQTTQVLNNEVVLAAILECKEGKAWDNFEQPVVNKSGELRTILWNSANINDSKGNYIATIVQGTDITERKKADEYNVYLSYHDHLTNINNRRFFEYQMKKLNNESILPLTIIMGDVNGLKLINDSFGHEAGDQLLIEAAQVIRKGCREHDIIARIGGDEFGIILTNTDGESAEKIIARIKEEAAAIDFDNALLSISFGYATMYKMNKKTEEVMMEAENYMYRRKMYESASMRNKTIDVIMNALYEKSAREMHHSKRVSKISAAIAVNLGFAPDEVNKIRMSGLVHDIGKIGISEKILNKPAKLDDEEWAKMKKHPEAGWRILSSAKEFSDLAKQILYHHERWDGSGYPEGLKGEEIPFEARIIAVADAYDAMTSNRPYSKAVKRNDVVNELESCSGKQFDPSIISMFLAKVLKNINDESN